MKLVVQADKAFPRDFMQKGRVRVLVQENKQSVHPDIHTSACPSSLAISLLLLRLLFMPLSKSRVYDTHCGGGGGHGTEAALMVKLGELIPRLQSRQGGGAAASGAAAAGGKGGKRDKRKGR